MTNTNTTPSEAEQLADAILRLSGSNLRNYTLPKTREAIIAAAQHGIDKARAELLEHAVALLTQIESLQGESSCIDEDLLQGDEVRNLRIAISKATDKEAA